MSQFSHYMQLPFWRKSEQIFSLLPTDVKSWLLDSDSLTQRLIKHAKQHDYGQFRVKVVAQQCARPQVDEAKRLGIKTRENALIREVVLYAGDSPLVFARSVIPYSTLTGEQRILANLGNRSLGAFLFAQPTLHRDPIEIAQLRSNKERFTQIIMQKVHGLEAAQTQDIVELWARRSVFSLKQKSLMVYEVFLPDLWAPAS